MGGYTGLFHELTLHIPTSDLDDKQKRAIIRSSIQSGSFTETTKVAEALQIKIEDLDGDTQYNLLYGAINSRSEAMVKDFIRAIPINTFHETYRQWILSAACDGSIDMLNIIMPYIDLDGLCITEYNACENDYANAHFLCDILSALVKNNRVETVKKLIQPPKADLGGSHKVKRLKKADLHGEHKVELLKMAIERNHLEMVDILAGSFQLGRLHTSDSSDLWEVLAIRDSVEINNIIDKHCPFNNLSEFNRRRFFKASIKHGSKTFKMLLEKLPARSLLDV